MRKKQGDFEFVRDFLHKLVRNSTSSSSPSHIGLGGSWFRKGEGMLTLESEELRDYRGVLSGLVEKLAPDQDLSQSAIDSVLWDAIFEAVDIPERRDQDPTIRVNAAIRKLETLASRDPEVYDCWIEVGGLDRKSRPSSFGRVRFVAFNQHQLRMLRRAIAREGGQTSRARESLDLRKDRLLGRSFGVVKTTARDYGAALNLARREVQAAAECLNFFSDLVPYNYSWIFLPGEQESSSTTTFAVNPAGGMHMKMSRVGPMGGYSLAKLSAQKRIQKAIKRVRELLEKQSRNEVEELLLTAVRWSGRATVPERLEESFLLYAIALECIVLPGTDGGELRHRLSQRVARLLGGDMGDRVVLQKKTKKLYDIRSKIVHSGFYEVNEDDLNVNENNCKESGSPPPV